jgi:hypothetical protein
MYTCGMMLNVACPFLWQTFVRKGVPQQINITEVQRTAIQVSSLPSSSSISTPPFIDESSSAIGNPYQGPL